MRITNRIMTNNSLSNINKNKTNLTTLEEQYNTGKKIQRPSDDPIIAVRALRLRSNLTELNQYYEKNIPDARSWMQVTESSLNQINSLLTSIHTLCDQASQDTLTAEDRNSIMQTILQYKDQIYQEGNASYAGRYVFSGFKTNTSLAYLDDDSTKQYCISENFIFSEDIDDVQKLKGVYTDESYKAGGDNNFEEPPKLEVVHRLRLSYDKLDKPIDDFVPVLTYVDAEGETQTVSLNYTTEKDGEEQILSCEDPEAYSPEDGEANFLADSGEIIIPEDLYEELMTCKSMNVTYYKSEFMKNDLRPEHYFDCTSTRYNKDGELTDEVITYVKEDQDIEYEVSFNQKLAINTQGADSITHDIARELNELSDALGKIAPIESYIASIDKQINGTTDPDELKSLNELKTQLTLQLDLANAKLQDAFEKSLDFITGVQETVNIAVADLGSRMVRLDLTEDRLSTQQNEFEELMSNNEDADLVDTIVRFNSQEVIYNASLQAASQVVQNTLMDFIR